MLLKAAFSNPLHERHGQKYATCGRDKEKTTENTLLGISHCWQDSRLAAILTQLPWMTGFSG